MRVRTTLIEVLCAADRLAEVKSIINILITDACKSEGLLNQRQGGGQVRLSLVGLHDAHHWVHWWVHMALIIRFTWRSSVLRARQLLRLLQDLQNKVSYNVPAYPFDKVCA